MWEAAMSAANFKLNNLIMILDRNRLQIDGGLKMSCGWSRWQTNIALSVGKSLRLTVIRWKRSFRRLRKPGPIKAKSRSCILANTIKGRGVSFMENVVGWHGKPPKRDELDKALGELGLTGVFDIEAFAKHAAAHQTEVEKKLAAKMPKFSRDYWWNGGSTMKVAMDPNRMGLGRALDEYGGDERVVCIGADISDSITISDFYKKHPERKNRWFSVGVAEQGGTTVAAGFAKEGKLPVFGTYGVFSCGSQS